MILHDLTRPLRSGMPVYPGDPPCTLAWASTLADAGVNVAQFSLGTHTGTHVDAPFHLLPEGVRVGELALETFIGPAQVVDASGVEQVTGDWLASRLGAGATRVLLRTCAWRDEGVFPERWPALTADAARLLVAWGVRLLGTDAPSPDAPGSAELPVHRILLAAGLAIVENLLLDAAPLGRHELIAFPLRLAEADASPLRAVLVER